MDRRGVLAEGFIKPAFLDNYNINNTLNMTEDD